MSHPLYKGIQHLSILAVPSADEGDAVLVVTAEAGPGVDAMEECSRWAVVLACSAATGELPLVGLKLLHDLVHVLYCCNQQTLEVNRPKLGRHDTSIG